MKLIMLTMYKFTAYAYEAVERAEAYEKTKTLSAEWVIVDQTEHRLSVNSTRTRYVFCRTPAVDSSSPVPGR